MEGKVYGGVSGFVIAAAAGRPVIVPVLVPKAPYFSKIFSIKSAIKFSDEEISGASFLDMLPNCERYYKVSRNSRLSAARSEILSTFTKTFTDLRRFVMVHRIQLDHKKRK